MTGAPLAHWLGADRPQLAAGHLCRLLAAVFDQVLVSLGTFLLHVLLARYTSPADYGVFVLCYSGIVFGVGLQNALVTEPMMIFGSTKSGDQRSRYLSSALLLQIGVTTALLATVWLACFGWWAMGRMSVSLMTVAAGALGLVGIQAREFTRKVFFTTFSPGRALANDGLYLGLLVLGLGLLAWRSWLTAAATFLVLAAAGIASAAVGLARTGLHLRVPSSDLRQAVRTHWVYGRWMIGVAGARWSANDLYYFVAALFLGTSGSAALKAVQNVFAPVSLFITGFGNLLLPVASRLAQTTNRSWLNRFVVIIGVVLGAAVLAYVITVSVSPSWVFRVLYRGDYVEYAYLLPILGAGHVLVAAFQGPSLGLRALNRPKAIFLITGVGAAATTIAVVPLTAVWGLFGAAVAVLLTMLIGSPLWTLLYWRAAHDEPEPMPST